MKITYDPDVDAMNIQFQKGNYDISKEVADGIIVDYSKDGRVMAIEILDAKKRMPIKNIKSITIGIPVESIKPS